MVIRLAILLFSLQRISADVVQLDTSNFDAITKSNDIVFVNFYAEWCRFSQMLKPIFAQASQKFQNLPQGKVVWGAVDADRQAELATRFQVNKYPTLKLFRNGEIVRKEYRSQRSVEALSDFVQKQLDSGINEIQSQDDLKIKLDKNKRNVIAYFSQPSGPDYESLKKVASILREECSFYVGSGPTFSSFTANGPYLLYIGKNAPDGLPFNGDMKQYDFLKQWLTDKCIPLVREITFENAEELTEEGIPFLILFRHPNDKESEKIFTDAVIRELPDQKDYGEDEIEPFYMDLEKFYRKFTHTDKVIVTSLPWTCESLTGLCHEEIEQTTGFTLHTLPVRMQSSKSMENKRDRVGQKLGDVLDIAGINCLVADGEKFAHPLHHLGKRESDLPVIAIDSFRHMYLFPNANDLNIPGKLRQFVLDLYSGKLHREFHNGPDIVSRNVETQPPPSVFEKLKPSHNRYTLLEKDEL